MKYMKQAKLLFLLIATLAFASCRQTARQTVADAEQPTDSTEALTSADTLRMVIIDKSISRIDSVVQARIINPNNYDVSYGQEYAIERETEGHWQQVPFPKNFGFTSVLSTVAAHGSATVYGHIGLLHLTPGHYRLTKQIQTNRRPHPLRRLLHPQYHYLPHTCLQVRNKLFSAKECKNYQKMRVVVQSFLSS